MSTSLAYKPEIDGLRAFAVLSVLFYHLDQPWMPGGFAGVDVFFVISGYLITGIILPQMREGRFSFAEFYARRVKRIFPALFFVLAFFGVAAFFMLEAEEYRRYFRDAKYAGLQIANFRFLEHVDYFEQDRAPSAVLHTWSLGVEEQYYLLWPLLLLAAWRMASGRLAAWVAAGFALSLGLCIWQTRVDQPVAFYMLHTRAWELLMGGALAMGFLPQVRRQATAHAASVLALAGLLAAVVLFDATDFPGAKALLPCVAAALFIHSARHVRGWGHLLLSWKPVVLVGLVSYSLYLWHWPLISFYKIYTDAPLTALSAAIIGCLSVLLAWFSYRFVETPARLSRRPARQVLAMGAVAIVLAVVVTPLARTVDDSSIRLTAEPDANLYTYSPIAKRCMDAIVKDDDAPPCMIGAEDGTKTALLIGDSHGGHYTEMVDSWARHSGVRVTAMVRNGCPQWVATPRKDEGGVADTCPPAEEKLKAFIEARHKEGLRYDYIFLAARGDAVEKRFRETLQPDEAAIKAMGDSMKAGTALAATLTDRLVILGQVPIFETSPAACYFRAHLWMSRIWPVKSAAACARYDESYSRRTLAASSGILWQLASENRYAYFDPAAGLHAALWDEGRPLYKDRDHMNINGAGVLMPVFSDFMADVTQGIEKK